MEQELEMKLREMENKISLLTSQVRQLEFAVDPENVLFDDGETLVQKLNKKQDREGNGNETV